MKKIFTIAAREYRAMVGTKAFLASIVMMPILMLGGLFATEFLKDMGEVKERKIAIIDQSGFLFNKIETAVNLRNGLFENDVDIKKLQEDLTTLPEDDEKKSDSDSDSDDGKEKKKKKDDDSSPLGPNKDIYVLERIETDNISDEQLVDLSQRVKNQDLYAFLVIPEGSTEAKVKESQKIRFYAQDSSLSDARRFFQGVINESVKERRLMDEDVNPAIVQKASIPVPFKGMGLVEKSYNGDVKSAEESDPMQAIFLPMGVMMMMFMVIFMASQPMLESVIEEKSQRIAEVLLGSANPMQLMSGKLLGTVGGSLTVFAIYLVGAYGLAVYKGWTDDIPFELAPWFIVFQVVGVLFYAAIFMAVGASVSQLKEAQSMLLPVWMLLMMPMFIWIFVIRDPLGTMATGVSLFPPATPTTMMLRMATGVTIPIWQPIVGLIATLLATLLIVFLAARIFRVGILWQGKTPKLSEIAKWAFSNS